MWKMWKLLNRDSKTLEIEEIIDIRSAEIRINELLFEHGKWMIANCIAKSEICTVYKNQNEKKDMYYLLNVRPNPNQTATEFWLDVIDKYYSYKGEVLIVNIGDHLYVADSYTKSNDVLYEKTFYNVTLKIDNDYLKLRNQFNADSSMLIRRKDKKVDTYLTMVNDKISDLMIAAMSAYRKKSPKYKMKIPNGFRIQTKEGKPVTGSEYADQISKELDNPSTSTIVIPQNLDFDAINNSGVSSDEISSIFNHAAKNVAMALNIPINAFLGSITEKSDAVDELITFAVSIVVEQINDAFNYCLMSKDSFLNGSKIFFDLSNCKHRDILSNASGIDKLIADGFSINQILEMFGKPTFNEEWANTHSITKNYGKIDDTKGGEE